MNLLDKQAQLLTRQLWGEMVLKFLYSYLLFPRPKWIEGVQDKTRISHMKNCPEKSVSESHVPINGWSHVPFHVLAYIPK